MPQTQQILQIILFSIPILSMLLIGVVILCKSLSVINHRWYLGVILPVLLANLLTYFNPGNSIRESILDWEFLLIFVVDLVLIGGVFRLFQGMLVYGLSLAAVEETLEDALTQQGYKVDLDTGEKRSLLGGSKKARKLNIKCDERIYVIWLTERVGEVRIQAESRRGQELIRSCVNALRMHQPDYDLKAHAIGALYLVVALVFTVLIWIFFYEPRLILLE